MFTDEQLARVYKEHHQESHLAAIRAIYELGRLDPLPDDRHIDPNAGDEYVAPYVDSDSI